MQIKTDLTFAVIIPARYRSSRFPGKPLVEIQGRPMIKHVFDKCVEAVGRDKVYIATDDDRIKNVSEAFGANVVMTSPSCLTGTDRLAEANEQLDLDFVINVQGDEPLVAPESINKVVQAYVDKPGEIVNAMCATTGQEELTSLNVPKVVVSKSGKLLYMSRSILPGNKSGDHGKGFKQVCIYAFSREDLQFFKTQQTKTPLESVEDIEILRFLENDISIRMVEVPSGSVAVDVPSDVDAVLRELKSSSQPD